MMTMMLITARIRSLICSLDIVDQQTFSVQLETPLEV